MASREELLQSIQPEMKLNKNFFLQIYGYEIIWSGFAEIALNKLKAAGCSRAEEYYTDIVREYEAGYQEMVKNVAQQYFKNYNEQWEIESKREGSVIKRNILEIRKKRQRELVLRKQQLLMQKSQILTRN